ncbi:MAG: esterase family protein, partial [Acidobacteriia bacterium]|nr:esterase family protein [Terriglobia bacterium]
SHAICWALAVALGGAAITAATAARAAEEPAGVLARNVSTVHFFSDSLNEQRAFNLILPIDYEISTNRYPVLYLLHGYTGGNNNWTLLTNLSGYVARYRLIVVMPDGSNGWYVNSATDPKAKFEDYIIKDIIPYVEKHYRTIPLRRARAITGLSMGGYGAMFLGLKHPDLFAAIGAFSGALDVAHNGLPPDTLNATEKERKQKAEITSHFGPPGSPTAKERDPFEILAKVPREQMPTLYIAEGGEDFLIKGNREFVAELAKLKVPYEYREVSPREHTWDFWDEQVRIFLEKLARLEGFESGVTRGPEPPPPGPRDRLRMMPPAE